MKWLPVIEKNFTVVSKGGVEVQCVCPWHPDKSGHLYINAVKGLYLCMNCGAKGSLERLGASLPTLRTQDVRERLRQVTRPEKKVSFYPETWLKQFDVPHDYWGQERGLSPETIQRWRLGYDPFSDRCTIPMRDTQGRIMGVSYRRLDGQSPKYLDPTGYKKGRFLYGAWNLTPSTTTVAVVEGQMDAIAADSARVPAVATMGSRMTADQVKVLQHLGIRKVIGMYDNDNAGRKAVVQTYGMLRGSGIRYLAGWYRPYWVEHTTEGIRPVKDPDGLTPDRIRKMYHSAIPILDWIERTGFVVE